MGSSQSENVQTDHIPIGYVRKAHGIRGDVVVRGLVEDAGERFVVGVTLLTGQTPGKSLDVVARRMIGDDLLLHLRDIDTRNDAEALIGVQFVVARSQRRQLDSDEWWVEDLVGCDVFDKDGHVVGTVIEVVSGAAQDRLVVETPRNTRAEIPLVAQLVPHVDVAARQITVDLPEGLVE